MYIYKKSTLRKNFRIGKKNHLLISTEKQRITKSNNFLSIPVQLKSNVMFTAKIAYHQVLI